MMGISSNINFAFSAQQTTQTAGERFRVADANGDEHVSKTEFGDFAELKGVDSNRATKIFALVDKDGNGQISRSEQQDVISFMRERKEQLFSSQIGGNQGFDPVNSLIGSSQDESRTGEMKHRWQDEVEKQHSEDYHAAKRAKLESLLERIAPEVDIFA